MINYDLLKNKVKKFTYLFYIYIVSCIILFIILFNLRKNNTALSLLEMLFALMFSISFILIFVFRNKLRVLKKDLRDIEIVKASIDSSQSNKK